MQQPSVNAMEIMGEPEHVTAFEDPSCLRKHQRSKRGRPKKASTHCSPLDAMDLVTQPEHSTPFKGVPCLRKHQKGKRGRPRKVSRHQPPLDAVDSITDSMISPRRPLLVIRRPRGRLVRSPKHTAESTAYDDSGDIGRRAHCRGRARDIGDRVISPQNAPGEQSVQEVVEATTSKDSTGTEKANRRRLRRFPMSRGTALPQDTPETLQEVLHVSQRKSEEVKLSDAARDPGQAGKDKEPVNSCNDVMMA